RPDPAERLLGARKPPLIALLGAILLAGCAGAGHSPCSARIRAALAASSKAVAAGGPAICDYRGATTAVRVTVDTHPQAYRRWSNTEVELGQNTAGWHRIPGGEPHPLDGVGIGAYWVPGQRTLSATDGARLVTVRVTSGRDPLRLAT